MIYRIMILSGLFCLSLCVQANPVFNDARDLDSFELKCDQSPYDITTHYKLRDGVYSYFTITGDSSRKMLLSAVPSRAAVSNEEREFDTGRTVEWSEINIAFKQGSEFLESTLGEPNLMIITIKTENNPSGNRWSNVGVKRIDAFFDSDGYLMSVYESDIERDRCALIEMQYEEE